LVFAEIQDHGRRRDDKTGVSEPVQRRALVCGGCGYGTPTRSRSSLSSTRRALTDEEFTAGKKRILGL
jgi:hypothetical protein